MGEQRFIGGFPKIGIRPTVDGRRRGVRELIEPQAMNLAKAVAALLSETLRYPNGDPIELKYQYASTNASYPFLSCP